MLTVGKHLIPHDQLLKLLEKAICLTEVYLMEKTRVPLAAGHATVQNMH